MQLRKGSQMPSVTLGVQSCAQLALSRSPRLQMPLPHNGTWTGNGVLVPSYPSGKVTPVCPWGPICPCPVATLSPQHQRVPSVLRAQLRSLLAVISATALPSVRAPACTGVDWDAFDPVMVALP